LEKEFQSNSFAFKQIHEVDNILTWLMFRDIFSYFLEECKGSSGAVLTQIPLTHLRPGKGDGAAYPGGHQQASGGKERYQE